MTRFITATLTLALISGLSSGKASAQISMTNTAEGGLNEISGIIVRFAATETGIIDPADCPSILDDMPFLDQVFGDQEGESLMNTRLADHKVLDDSTCWDFSIRRFESIMDPATAGIGVHPWDRAGVIDPSDTTSIIINLGGQEGEDIMDLWFELVDAGYTEDEAFDLVELVMGYPSWRNIVDKDTANIPIW